MIPYLLGASVVAVGLGWLARRHMARRGRARFDRLVALCHQDREVATRLVAGEARRWPNMSSAAHVERAIDRLLADRRR